MKRCVFASFLLFYFVFNSLFVCFFQYTAILKRRKKSNRREENTDRLKNNPMTHPDIFLIL